MAATLVGCRVIGTGAFWRGDVAMAREPLERTLALAVIVADARGLGARLGSPFPEDAAPRLRGALAELCGVADRYYASSDVGLEYLSWRCALGVNAARRIYSAIGSELERQGWDVQAPRAYVSRARKLWLCARAAGAVIGGRWLGSSPPFQAVPLNTVQHGAELIPL